MVQAIHVDRIEAAIRQNGIPALPNGGSAHLYLVQPTGIFFLQQQFSRNIVLAVIAERQAEVRRSHEAGGQVIFVGFHILHQPMGDGSFVFFFHQIELQRQNHSGLGLADQTAILRHIFIPESR